MRDLTGAAPEEVAAERARVATEGWGARLLALEGADGLWDGGALFPAGYTGGEPFPADCAGGEPFPAGCAGGEPGQPWTTTLHTLQTLQIFGLDPASGPARRFIDERAPCRESR